MASFNQLVSGFRIFKATTYEQKKDLINHVVQLGETPKTLVVACCDMRVGPSDIFASNPGDLYVIRNIAGLIPPYNDEGTNGTIAAIEYAISVNEVENIVVIGHADCSAIKILMDDNSDYKKKNPAMDSWLKIAENAKNAVNEQMADYEFEEKCIACEQEAILVSLHNILSFPSVKDKVKNNKMMLYGVHFDISKGELLAFDPTSKFFEPVE